MSRYPSPYRMALNLLRAIWRFATGGFRLVSKEQQQERLAICSFCPLKDPEAERCTECGCWLAAKTRLKSESCPKGFWK